MKQKKRAARSLVLQKVENVSKDLFRNYYGLVTELIGSSPGIYALYDGNELYYVGKSTDLRKRVKDHLRDRHFASWTHFSLYLVRRAEHIHEIEQLLIRIADPKGNRTPKKGKAASALLKKLKQLVKRKQADEFVKMFGVSKGKRESTPHPKTLKGLVTERTPLHRLYKGKEYRGFLYPNGIIKIGTKSFTTPTRAALSILKRYGRHAVNGWHFWYIKDLRGEWVTLSDYRA
ncbi:MAG: GIY-YIG nuclease family protein [Candidatus Zixiibacteriota bacterium]